MWPLDNDQRPPLHSEAVNPLGLPAALSALRIREKRLDRPGDTRDPLGSFAGGTHACVGADSRACCKSSAAGENGRGQTTFDSRGIGALLGSSCFRFRSLSPMSAANRKPKLAPCASIYRNFFYRVPYRLLADGAVQGGSI